MRRASYGGGGYVTDPVLKKVVVSKRFGFSWRISRETKKMKFSKTDKKMPHSGYLIFLLSKIEGF
jgi:hypothetical protein